MKKFILIALLLVCVLQPAYPYEYKQNVKDGLSAGDKIFYEQKSSRWSKDKSFRDMHFKKYITTGTGSFSVFAYRGNLYDTGTTYEFLDGNKLIGYNAHKLKFYELTFSNQKINKKELSKEQVKQYFPDVDIIKISELKDNKLDIEKPWFKRKTFMLLNDTDEEFYKYQFERYKQDELIRGLFEAKYPRKFIFSHFKANNEMFPALEINIHNKKLNFNLFNKQEKN